MSSTQIVDLLQNLGKLAPRNHPIHSVIISADAPISSECIFSCGPKFLSLRLVLSHANFAGVISFDDLQNSLHLLLYAGCQAVDLNKQYCFRILGDSGGVDTGLNGLNGVSVNHLQSGWNNAASNDSRNRFRCIHD